MKANKLAVLLVVVLLINCTAGTRRPGENIPVKLGVDVFLEEYVHLVKGKRIGLITNPSGVNSEYTSTADLFFNHPDITLAALYGPEHGVRGNAQPGEYVPFYIDEKYNLPVFSLYGQSKKPEPDMLRNIDEYMRSFDVQETGKRPEIKMVNKLDIMVFDIQDVGTRIYTYVSTMAYCMQTCAELGMEFIVLDRPNPINGISLEGPVLDYPEYSNFMGLYSIPVRHGMTVGELAHLFNDEFFEKKVKLTVIPAKNWKRDMWYDETGLPWIIPSPNMPTLDTATVYPGQVYLEGTNVSEGRGTTRPFELFGAPWIDGNLLAARLNSLGLKGVTFREAWFTPVFSKFKGKLCGGCQIHVIDREIFQPFLSTLFIIHTIRNIYTDEFEFHADYFDMIMGNSYIREMLEKNEAPEAIIRTFEEDIRKFSGKRQTHLLY